MKIMKMYVFFVSLCALLGSQWVVAQPYGGPHDAQPRSPFHAANAKMMQDMHERVPTGDVDYDFMRGMIPHHQGAVDMAQVMLEQGADESMLKLAREILAAQKGEITQMQEWLQAHGQPEPAEQAQDIVAAWQRIDQRMMSGMQHPSSGDVTRDFVQGMIPHHIAAVDMAYVLLAHSSHSGLREMARAVIREQEREIRQLNTWLLRAKTSADPHEHF